MLDSKLINKPSSINLDSDESCERGSDFKVILALKGLSSFALSNLRRRQIEDKSAIIKVLSSFDAWLDNALRDVFTTGAHALFSVKKDLDGLFFITELNFKAFLDDSISFSEFVSRLASGICEVLKDIQSILDHNHHNDECPFNTRVN